jgi:hypothetical protein
LTEVISAVGDIHAPDGSTTVRRERIASDAESITTLGSLRTHDEKLRGIAVAQSPGEAPDARAICDSIDAITARRPRSPQEPRGESDPLVVEATGLMAQPSRQAVLAAIGAPRTVAAQSADNTHVTVSHRAETE